MSHPSYSPDLAPSGLHLFGPFKKYVAGRRFATDADMTEAVTSWLQTLDTDFFCVRIQFLVSQWDRYFNVSGDYVEV
jgi:hypothetical protein